MKPLVDASETFLARLLEVDQSLLDSAESYTGWFRWSQEALPVQEAQWIRGRSTYPTAIDLGLPAWASSWGTSRPAFQAEFQRCLDTLGFRGRMGSHLLLPLRRGVVEPEWQMGLGCLERHICPIAERSERRVSAASLETFPT